MGGDWPWSSADNAKLFAGLAFLTIGVPALMCLLWWIGTHSPGCTRDNNEED